jgi:nucleoside-diphosphate-sugar epimerase
MKKALVTGSSGQIGTNLALRLMEEGWSVYGLDRRENTWVDRIPTLIHDLCSGELKAALKEAGEEGFSVVVHLAAHAKVHELVLSPTRAHENITSTFHVLEYCRQGGIPIVFGSSREVYGDIHRQQTNESQADFVVAESPYSASKISGEALIYSYSRCYRLPYLVFRFSNVYGRYDNDLKRMERVVPLFTDRLQRALPVTIYGRQKVFDFTYVDDCVAGVVQGLERLLEGKVQNETFNLAYGEGHTLEDLVQYICEALGIRNADIRFEPARPGEVLRYIADIQKARDLLGYAPKVPLPEGIRRAIAWAQEYSRSRLDAAPGIP